MINNGVTYGLGALALGVSAIPLLYLLWRAALAMSLHRDILNNALSDQEQAPVPPRQELSTQQKGWVRDSIIGRKPRKSLLALAFILAGGGK